MPMAEARGFRSLIMMKTLPNIRHVFQRTRRRAIWSVASASVLPVALLIADGLRDGPRGRTGECGE